MSMSAGENAYDVQSTSCLPFFRKKRAPLAPRAEVSYGSNVAAAAPAPPTKGPAASTTTTPCGASPKIGGSAEEVTSPIGSSRVCRTIKLDAHSVTPRTPVGAIVKGTPPQAATPARPPRPQPAAMSISASEFMAASDRRYRGTPKGSSGGGGGGGGGAGAGITGLKPRNRVASASPSVASTAVDDDFDVTEQFEECAAEAFGPGFLAEFRSKKWGDRKACVSRISETMATACKSLAPGVSSEMFFSVSCELVRKCMEDKVAPVAFSGFGLFQALMKECATDVDAIRVHDALSNTIMALLEKLGENNARTQREAARCVMQAARTHSLGGLTLVAPILLQDCFALRPRLQLLAGLLADHKHDKTSALNIPSIMTVAVPALQVADDKTRKAAINLVIAAYKTWGKRVHRHLTNVKPALLKMLNRQFAEVDGSGSSKAKPLLKEVRRPKGLAHSASSGALLTKKPLGKKTPLPSPGTPHGDYHVDSSKSGGFSTTGPTSTSATMRDSTMEKMPLPPVGSSITAPVSADEPDVLRRVNSMPSGLGGRGISSSPHSNMFSVSGRTPASPAKPESRPSSGRTAPTMMSTEDEEAMESILSSILG